MHTPEITRNEDVPEQKSRHEIPVPGLEQIVPEKGIVQNPEAGDSGAVIAEIKREEESERQREKTVDEIIKKRDRKIH